MKLHGQRKFTALLLTLITVFVVHPLMNHESPVFSLVYRLTLLAIFTAVGLALTRIRAFRYAGILLGIPTGIGLFAGSFWTPPNPMIAALVLHFFPILFLGCGVVAILNTIFDAEGITTDSVNGAFCGYLILGLMFGHLYCLIDAFSPGSFHLEPHVNLPSADDCSRHLLLNYYSLITLTTTGYGDITPRSGPARSIACVQAIIGQFYVAVVIAELIALKVASSLKSSHRHDEHAPKPERPN